MKNNQPPPVGAPIAFGGDDAPPEGDYYVPPADYVPPVRHYSEVSPGHFVCDQS